MALIKCTECGHQLSTEAAACPQCGARPQKPTSYRALALAGIVLVVVVKCVYEDASQPARRPDTVSTAPDPAASARYVCKDFITRSGYDVPDFAAWHDWTTIQNADGTWSVGARFMGAPPGGVMRNLYLTCVMSNAGDNWKLINLTRLN